MDSAADHAPVAASYSSTLAVGDASVFDGFFCTSPPAISVWPDGRSVAVWLKRLRAIDPDAVHFPVAGS